MYIIYFNEFILWFFIFIKLEVGIILCNSYILFTSILLISIEDVYHKIKNGSPEPKGVYYALTTKGFGLPITDWRQVKRGDFVQFWYPDSWGHCGIVESINLKDKSMRLHSSFPSTDGYGIQEFQIPSYTWFVRLMIP